MGGRIEKDTETDYWGTMSLLEKLPMPGTSRSNSTVGSLGKAIRGLGLLDVLRMGVVPSKSQQLGSLIPDRKQLGSRMCLVPPPSLILTHFPGEKL